METNSFYFSRVLNNKLYTSEMKVIGKIKDFGVVNELKSPKVVVVKVKTNEGIKNVNWDNIIVKKQNGQYILTCTKLEEVNIKNMMFLKEHILDKQIIDVNGRKVVRVNDIRLAYLSTGFFVVAVDIGTEGLLRRLGFAKPLKRIGLKTTSKLMLWSDVETILDSSENIMVSKTYNKLSILHPSDLADIIEDFDVNTGMTILSNLGNTKAADVLEEMEEDDQVKIIDHLAPDKAADILEEMPPDEVADILDGLSDDKAEELLNSMEKEASDEVRELMKYDDDLVGSLMSTDYISFESNYTVEKTINSLRELKPEEDEMYYLYVVNDKNKLVGTVSLRDIIISEPENTLESIMNKNLISMFDTDEIEDLIKNVSKYNLVAIPIVNNKMNLVGNVIINDIIYELLKSKRRVG